MSTSSATAGLGGPGTFLRLFLVLSTVALAPLGYWALLDDTSRGAMIFVGVVCLLAIGFPLFVRGADLNPLEPIVLCMVAVAIGCTFRAIYIGYSDYYRSDFLTFGQSYSQIASGGLWVAASLACLSVGYLVTTGRIDLGRTRLLAERRIQIDGRFWLVAIVGIVLTILSTLVFVRLFQIGLSADSISRKRQLDVGGEDTSALGPVRLLSGFAECSLYALVAVKAVGRERWKGAQVVLAIALLSASAVIPFITSSRSSLGIILINCLALFYLAGKLRVPLLVLVAVSILTIVTVMGDLRSGGRDADAGATAIDAIVGSGNFVDLARTTAIADRVPDVVPYQDGRTYASLLTAPMPSALWPDKPPVSLGPYVKSEVFGQRTVAGGWPPGILGEAAINFGIPGMLVVSFIFGIFLRFVYNSFEPLMRTSVTAAVLYVTIFWPLGLQLIGSSFSHGVVRTLQALIPALVIVVAVSRRNPQPASGSVLSRPKVSSSRSRAHPRG